MNLGFSIFEAFAGGIVSGQYEIGILKAGTLTGNQFTPINDLDVVVDEGDYTNLGAAPNAQETTADMLMYCRPEQLPTLSTRTLIAGFMIHDKTSDDYFAILRASKGKNQQTEVVTA